MMGWRDRYAELIGKYPHKQGAELGVLKGQNSATLLETLPDLELLYCVDIWAKENGLKNMEIYLKSIKPYEDRVKTLHMKTVEAASKVKDESLDFVFIDAYHSYEAVIADVNAWSPKVKKGGIISGDDYIDYKKTKIHNPGGRYDVKGAIDDVFPNANIQGRVWWVIKK